MKISWTGKINDGYIQRHTWQMNEEFRSFTRKELAQQCRRVFGAANKRLNRLESSGLESPALRWANKTGGKFVIKGMDLKSLQKEYERAFTFLNSPTSTVSGAREYSKAIEQKFGHPLTAKQHERIFEAFRTVEKVSPAGVQAYGSEHLIQYLADEITAMDDVSYDVSEWWDDMLEKTLRDVDEQYEQRMEEFNQTFRDLFSM